MQCSALELNPVLRLKNHHENVISMKQNVENFIKLLQKNQSPSTKPIINLLISVEEIISGQISLFEELIAIKNNETNLKYIVDNVIRTLEGPTSTIRSIIPKYSFPTSYDEYFETIKAFCIKLESNVILFESALYRTKRKVEEFKETIKRSGGKEAIISKTPEGVQELDKFKYSCKSPCKFFVCISLVSLLGTGGSLIYLSAKNLLKIGLNSVFIGLSFTAGLSLFFLVCSITKLCLDKLKHPQKLVI
ncbi:MAG: hypothetical protein LBJ93_01645 [Clostridiales bacterium]|jgi:hypothetical protein|nr:hypothetical protein [Clostridiales bacterium]